MNTDSGFPVSSDRCLVIATCVLGKRSALQEEQGIKNENLWFKAWVDYVHPMSTDRKKIFRYIEPGLDTLTFTPIARCKEVVRTKRELIFLPFRINPNETVGQLMRRMSECGYRPALFEELVSIPKIIPPGCKTFSFIALGSIALMDSRQYFAVLTQRFLHLMPVNDLGVGDWALAVREPSDS